MDDFHKEITKLTKQIAEKEQERILDQLNELVSRGLLVIERQQPTLVTQMRNHNDAKTRIDVMMAVKLILKDQEYIEQLERENAEMKDALMKIKELDL